MMKLYIYEHCPYCVKARLIFGLKKVPVTLCYLPNDEEKILVDLVGVKQVPVLEYETGRAMAESLDIIAYIDHLDGEPLVRQTQHPEFKRWLNALYPTFNRLAMPNYVLADFPEFQTQSARDYYQKKKEGSLGENFMELRKKRPEYTQSINAALVDLEEHLTHRNWMRDVTYDDFHLFAVLRNLTLFKDIDFPRKVRAYAEELSATGRVPLLWSRQV